MASLRIKFNILLFRSFIFVFYVILTVKLLKEGKRGETVTFEML